MSNNGMKIANEKKQTLQDEIDYLKQVIENPTDEQVTQLQNENNRL